VRDPFSSSPADLLSTLICPPQVSYGRNRSLLVQEVCGLRRGGPRDPQSAARRHQPRRRVCPSRVSVACARRRVRIRVRRRRALVDRVPVSARCPGGCGRSLQRSLPRALEEAVIPRTGMTASSSSLRRSVRYAVTPWQTSACNGPRLARSYQGRESLARSVSLHAPPSGSRC
jgi:hypothetical protein